MSYAVSMIRLGRTMDPESDRHSWRLQQAWAILGLYGVEHRILHTLKDGCNMEPNRWPRKGYCTDACRFAGLPAWLTDEAIAAAYNAASALQGARGAHNRAEAEALHQKMQAADAAERARTFGPGA